jgi:hypothetical protein
VMGHFALGFAFGWAFGTFLTIGVLLDRLK